MPNQQAIIDILEAFVAGMQQSIGNEYELEFQTKAMYPGDAWICLRNGTWNDSMVVQIRSIQSTNDVMHLRDRILAMKKKMEVAMSNSRKVRRTLMMGQAVDGSQLTDNDIQQLQNEGIRMGGIGTIATADKVSHMLPLTENDIKRIDVADKHLAEYLANILDYREGLHTIHKGLEGVDAKGNPKSLKVNSAYTAGLIEMVEKFIVTINQAQKIIGQVNSVPAHKKHQDVLDLVEKKMKEFGLI